MPPSGIDRFNFVVAGSGLEIKGQGGKILGWDAGGGGATWNGDPVPAVSGNAVGSIQSDLFPVTKIHVEFMGGIKGAQAQKFHLDVNIKASHPNYVIGYVTFGLHETPNRGSPFEPFAWVELAGPAPANAHECLSFCRGHGIR